MKHIPTIIMSLALATAVVALSAQRAGEPGHDGRKLSYWLDQLNADDRNQQKQARDAVRAIGTDALPMLKERLTARDSFLGQKLDQIAELASISVPQRMEERYDTALLACAILGPESAPLTGEILPFLEDSHRAVTAVRVLVAIGDDAIAPVVGALSGTNEQSHTGAAAVLGALTANPDTVVPALLTHADAGLHETRMAVAWALGKFGVETNLSNVRLYASTNHPSGELIAETATR